MRRTFLTLLMTAMVTLLSAQPWRTYLSAEKAGEELTINDFRKAFDQWITDEGIIDGKKIVDGEWVKVPGYKQFKRWEYNWEIKINNETGAFPKTTAYAEFKKYMEHRAPKMNLGNWVHKGPNNTTGGYAGLGRVNCITFHPSNNNTFWIGTPAGGMWETTDGGTTWSPLTDNNGVLGVSDIVLANDFETSNTMYIATGDRAGGSLWSLGGDNANDNNSIGVLKSTDGGQTWTETGLTFLPRNRYTMGRLLMDPINGDVMIAGTSYGIYRTEDGGENWSRSMGSVYAIDMEFHPTNSDIVYASTSEGNQTRILKSTDNGQSFETIISLPASVRSEIAVTPDEPDFVYAVVANSAGGLNGIYKSTDAGENFNEIFDGDSNNGNMLGYYSNGSGENEGQGSYDLTIAVSPTNKDDVFIGGINTWKSTDGGNTWEINNMWTSSTYYNTSGAPEVHADKHVLRYRETDGTLFEGNDGGIYKTTNGGNTWTDLSNGLGITQIYRIGVSQTNPNLIITGNQDNGSKLVNGTYWNDVTGGDGMECIIDYTNTATQYATYVNGTLYRTLNSWGSRTTISSNVPGGANGAWVTPYIIDPTDNQTLYLGYDKIWKTTNRGTSWVQLGSITSPTDKFRSMAISESDNNIILAADLKTVYKTTDGGNSWSEVTSNISTSMNITNVAIHATNPDIMWATMGGYNIYRVYESTNGGETWRNIADGLPLIPVYTIAHNKLNTEYLELYAGTELGVYIKRGEAPWAPYMEGLPNVVVTELEIYYGENAEASKLVAATFGRGLWESELHVPTPDPQFTASPTSGDAPLEVVFTNLSVDADSYLWNFGDEVNSEEENPTHTYEEPGFYSVSLTAFDEVQENTETKENFIEVGENSIQVIEQSSFTIYPNPGNGIFTIKGTNNYAGTTIRVVVRDQNGRVLKTLNHNTSTNTKVNLSQLKSGIYYLAFHINGEVHMNKLVIK
jgi:PKD repeat protein